MAIASVLITKFQNMVDDALDSDYMYQLLNDAKDEVEGMIAWEQMKRETTTLSLLATPTHLLLVRCQHASHYRSA